jgi:hypothetical protein
VTAPVVVEVVGLKALQKDLKKLSTAERSPLLDGMMAAGRAAAEPVAAAVRSQLPRVTGTLAGDVRVVSSMQKTGAAVRYGRKPVPYAGAVDFGGWPGDRPYLARGRYMFPAAQNVGDRAARAYETELERIFGRSGIWTNLTINPAQVRDY